jgi:Pvc16 N-terminal domain
MSVAGCGQTIVDLLTARLTEAGLLGDYKVLLMAPREITRDLQNTIALILYRIDVDQTRRHVRLPRATPTSPMRSALGVELHYLLAVWGKGSAAGEQVTLGDCMSILDINAVIAGPLLSTAYTWEPDDALKVTVNTVSVEDMWRLWEGIDAAYQLSVPYLVRTIRLAPVETLTAPMADTRTLVHAVGIPS